jgi:hypothetical protein
VVLENGTSQDSSPWRKWQPFGWIILASALAHLWCLGSQFYMDDIPQICDSKLVRTGDLTGSNYTWWTYFCYHWQFRSFGMSALGFHAVNWLLHTGVACVWFGFGRGLVKEQRGVALFAALLFAVHPLGSEIPNYARTQDLAWVTLFSIGAAWSVLRFFENGGWWNWLLCGLCLLGAAFSKGPGLLHALMMSIAVGLVVSRTSWRRKFLGIATLIVVGAALAMLAGLATKIPDSSNPRLFGCGLTVCRVFWEFAWRSVIPVALSSDHHIAETLMPPGVSIWAIPDRGALIAAAAMLALAMGAVVLAVRKATHVVGLCLSVFVGTILFRVFYLMPEFMPEYRIYPGLPWFCLGASIVLSRIWRYLTPLSPRVPAAILLGLLALLSAKRSFLWHDLGDLMADVLKQYPTQARAVWELDDRDAAAGKWQAIIDRQNQVWPDVARRFHAENQRLAAARELPTGLFALAEVACAGHYAVAYAHLQGSGRGLIELARQEQYMKRLGLDPSAHSVHWAYFHHAKALVLEIAGKDQAALDLMRQSVADTQKQLDLERLEKKVRALKPGS